mgnify:FL=1
MEENVWAKPSVLSKSELPTPSSLRERAWWRLQNLLLALSRRLERFSQIGDFEGNLDILETFIGKVLVLEDKTELWFHIATWPPLIPLSKHRSFIEFEFQIMRTTDSEIGPSFSQKSENQGFSSHYIDFRISPVWRRNSSPMRESSPNLISQLLLVIEIRIFENLLLCQMVTSSNTKSSFCSFSKTRRSWELRFGGDFSIGIPLLLQKWEVRKII